MPTYADPPAPGPVETELRAISDVRERFRVKALRIKERIDSLVYPVSYVLDGYRVTVGASPLLRAKTLPDNSVIWGIIFRQVTARIVAGPQLPVDDFYVFVNPPIKVFNGTYRQITQGGVTIDYPNMQESLLDALERMLLDAVLHYARKQGAI